MNRRGEFKMMNRLRFSDRFNRPSIANDHDRARHATSTRGTIQKQRAELEAAHDPRSVKGLLRTCASVLPPTETNMEPLTVFLWCLWC